MIKAYFRAEKAPNTCDDRGMKGRHGHGAGNNMVDIPTLRTSDIVTSEERRRKLIVVGNDVVGLFPAMKEVNTGRAVGRQVFNSPMVVRGLDYMEV